MDPQTITMVGLFVFVLWLPTLTLGRYSCFVASAFKSDSRPSSMDATYRSTPRSVRRRRAVPGIVLLAAGIGVVLADSIVTR